MGVTFFFGIAALDYDSKTVGAAVSDLQHDIALPCVTLTRQDFMQNMPTVRAFCVEHNCRVYGGFTPAHERAMDVSRAKRAKVIDAHAAAHILTSFFLRRRRCG